MLPVGSGLSTGNFAGPFQILFLNSSVFSDMIVFLVYENWSEKTDFTAETIFSVTLF